MGPHTETERSGRRGDHFQGSVDIALGPPDKLHEQTNLGFCSEQPERDEGMFIILYYCWRNDNWTGSKCLNKLPVFLSGKVISNMRKEILRGERNPNSNFGTLKVKTRGKKRGLRSIKKIFKLWQR